MRCWFCEQEIADESIFCMKCGADQRLNPHQELQPQEPEKIRYGQERKDPEPEKPVTPEKPAAPERPVAQERTVARENTAANTTAKEKKKINWVAILVAVAVFFGARYLGQNFGKAMANSGSSSSSSSSTSSGSVSFSTEDLITRHDVYCKANPDYGFRAYIIVYYGSDTHLMTGLTLEDVYEKSSGWSLNDVKSFGYEAEYPSFSKISYSETDDLVIVTIRMTDLKDTSRVQSLIEYEIVEASSGQTASAIDADSFMQSLLKNGWQTASYSDYSFLHFD